MKIYLGTLEAIDFLHLAEGREHTGLSVQGLLLDATLIDKLTPKALEGKVQG
jgi:hypothetical protein